MALRPGGALTVALLAGAVLLSCPAAAGQDVGEAVDAGEDAQDEAELNTDELKVRHAREIMQEHLEWRPDDQVEIFNAEFLLAAWVLDHAPWNAYHSGLALRNVRTGGKALYDYCPDDTSSVMRMVLPEVIIGPKWRAALGDHVYFRWNDQAHVEFFSEWPGHFTNFSYIGVSSGAGVFEYADWVANFYVKRYKAFNPVEVIISSKTRNQSRKAEIKLRSRMCHDFVTDSLWVLYDQGAKFKPKEAIFRDHILMYAQSVNTVESLEDTWSGRRQELRYLRSLNLFMERIREQFTYAREALVVAWRLQLPVLVHDEWGTYHKVKLVPPFLNYCYLPLAIPPEIHDPLTKNQLCALGQIANLTNATTPFPWGQLLAMEDRLDYTPALLSIFFTALCAAVAAGSLEWLPGSTSEPE